MLPRRKTARDRLRRASRTEYEKIVHEAKLTPKEEVILEMAVLHSKSIKDIENFMGFCETAVMKHLGRAYDKVSEVVLF